MSLTLKDITVNESFRASLSKILRQAKGVLHAGDIHDIKELILSHDEKGAFKCDIFDIHPISAAVETALILCERVAPDRTLLLSVFLMTLTPEDNKEAFIADMRKRWGDDIALTLERLIRVKDLYQRNPVVESENFKRLLLTFAEDICVIIIMLAERLALMNAINHHPLEDEVKLRATEARYLYAPLAHRLGLYSIKGDLEDLSLKYTRRDIYTAIARKLNETKTKRDTYIANFIAPVKNRLEQEGLKFEIKGRTKSIFSIWNKIKKQRIDIDHIYDLFAIRIVLDTEPEREKQDCWLAYSIITDMFRPNPARMKDWISIPKANGYESLHTTVYGPDNRWVEVQIRTRRMDEVAEKGLAAHWRYKGIKAEEGLDQWMGKIRDILENTEAGPTELMKNHRLDIYNNEIFVFTPKGDLYNLPAGATLLDFAFNIHTGLGAQCTGGRVNGKVRKINHKLENGDTVEIMSSPNQEPKQAWLNFVVTSKARNKIRSFLKENESRKSELGKELLQRRLKNRKLEIQEADLMKVIKKLGFKTSTEFFSRLGEDLLDINSVIDTYVEMVNKESASATPAVSADEFVLSTPEEKEESLRNNDILVIGNNIKGMNYRMAKCCNPIYGDDVFGFISAEGVVKIHRKDCPNANNIISKYPYRIIRTKWSGNFDGQMAATLTIIGNDDIGIVTNISSLITKSDNSSLRSISIDSHDGLFRGYVVVGVRDLAALNLLIKKIKTVKGVKDVQRTN